MNTGDKSSQREEGDLAPSPGHFRTWTIDHIVMDFNCWNWELKSSLFSITWIMNYIREEAMTSKFIHLMVGKEKEGGEDRGPMIPFDNKLQMTWVMLVFVFGFHPFPVVTHWRSKLPRAALGTFPAQTSAEGDRVGATVVLREPLMKNTFLILNLN